MVLRRHESTKSNSILSATQCYKYFCYLLIATYLIFLFTSSVGGKGTTLETKLSALPASPPKWPHTMIHSWALANHMDSLMTYLWNHGNYTATYICKLKIIVTQIVHFYSVITIHPFLMIMIQDIEAPTPGGVTIMNRTLAASLRRGLVATEMAPSGWVKLWDVTFVTW